MNKQHQYLTWTKIVVIHFPIVMQQHSTCERVQLAGRRGVPSSLILCQSPFREEQEKHELDPAEKTVSMYEVRSFRVSTTGG